MNQCMAIGGNLRLDGAIMAEFYRRSGGVDSRIVILPTASSRVDGGLEFQKAFCELGVKQEPALLAVRERAAAFDEEWVRQVSDASGIFFAGGDQLRLASVLTGTPLLRAIQQRCREGAILAGTSAGASVLGSVMIARGRSGSAARAGSAQFAAGLGFLDRVLIDQHFHQKNRLGRLIYAVTVHPGSLGIGVDEDTAALFEGDRLTVLGTSAVTVIDGQSITESNVDQVASGGLFSISALRLSQLTAGSSYDLAQREAVILRNPLEV